MRSVVSSLSRLPTAVRERWQATALHARVRDFHFDIGVHTHSTTLSHAPVAGRRTLYADLQIGRRHLWIQRWYTAACGKYTIFAFSRDRLMCWTGGTRLP